MADGIERSLGRAFMGNGKPDALGTLQHLNDREEALRRRVAAWPEHALETFGGKARRFRQAVEGDAGVDVVAQHGLAGVEVAGEQFVDRLGEHGGAEACVALGACPDGGTKFTGDGHSPYLFLRAL